MDRTNKSINKWILNGSLFSVIVVLFFLNFYSKTLFFGPMSIHKWRQADCLSITKNYFEEGMHFFSPTVHSLSAPGGKAVAEFPIINYTVALLWKIFGEHEFIYKLLEYCIFLISIFVLFNTLLKHYASKLLIFFMVGLLLTSPLLVYYSFNFLSDVPALSFSMIAFCFLFSFYSNKRLGYFYFALLFATTAVLFKASALLPLCCILFFSLVDLVGLNSFFKTEKLFQKKLMPLLLLCLSLTAIFYWYDFARHYNSFNNGIFLLTIVPFWEMTRGETIDVFRSLMNSLFPTFLNRPMLALFFSAVLYVIFNFRKLNSFLKYCFVFSFAFFLIYLMLFFQVFSVHDYYLINLFIFPIICFFCFLHIVSAGLFRSSNFINVLLILMFVFNALFSAATYRLKLINKDNLLEWYPFISKDELKAYRYNLWDENKSFKSLNELRPVLRGLGVKREEPVLCVSKGGPNVALYLIDQKGYVIPPEDLKSDSLALKKLVLRNGRYIILNDKQVKTEKGFKTIAPFFELLYRQGSLEVFKLKLN